MIIQATTSTFCGKKVRRERYRRVKNQQRRSNIHCKKNYGFKLLKKKHVGENYVNPFHDRV